ncbi:MAG: hypothetical protein RJA81_672 [Planctomycetota bacterium]
MHISDGILSGPVSLGCSIFAAGGIGLCIHQFRKSGSQAEAPRLGLVASFIFAAQMVNFPLGFAPISGHLMGGTLAASLLGPWGGGIAIAAVLIVQSLLMGDGALTALGANWINMGLIGSVGASYVLDLMRSFFRNRSGLILSAMITAWISVTVSAAAFSFELAISSGFQSFQSILTAMVVVHSIIAVGEAIITGLVLRGILWILMGTNPQEKIMPLAWSRSGLFIGGLMSTVAVVVFLAPLASSFPDGLEYVGEKFGFISQESVEGYQAPLPDYVVPAMGDGRWSTVIAGLTGSLVVLGSGFLISRGLTRRTSVTHS